MSSFDDHEKIGTVTRIGAVRRILNVEGCLDFNPFMRGMDTASLATLFGDIAKGAADAAQSLSEMTSVPVAEVGGTEKAVNLLYDLHSNDTGPLDVTLSPLFVQIVKEPYFGLRELESEELAGARYQQETAQHVMNGLAQVQTFAKAVKDIYQQSERNALIPAVA